MQITPNTYIVLRANLSNDTPKHPLAIQYMGIRSPLIRTRFIDSSDNDRDKERMINPAIIEKTAITMFKIELSIRSLLFPFYTSYFSIKAS